MTNAPEGSSAAPVLTQPLPVDWETLCKHSAPVQKNTPAATAADATPAPSVAGSLKVPLFREDEPLPPEAPPPGEPVAAIPPQEPPAKAESRRQVLWPEPEIEPSPRQAYYRPYPAQEPSGVYGATPPAGAYVQSQIERAIVARLEPLIENASRSAADAAADRIRTELLGKIDLIVREAVELEMSRFYRR